MLIGARLAQGLSAAVMVQQVLAILNVTFPLEEKTRVFGLFAAVSRLASVAGPVLGGGLIALDPWGLDWRAIFIVNVPLEIVAVIGSMFTVPRERSVSQAVDAIHRQAAETGVLVDLARSKLAGVVARYVD